MKPSEIKQKFLEGTSLRELIDIVPYLPVARRKLIIDGVLDSCLEYNGDGMLVCDYFLKNITFDIFILRHYAGIEIAEVEEYDVLNRIGVVDFVKEKLGKEVSYCVDLLEKEINQRINLHNGIAGAIARGLNRIADNLDSKKINKLIKSAGKELREFDLDKFGEIKSILGALEGGGKVG